MEEKNTSRQTDLAASGDSVSSNSYVDQKLMLHIEELNRKQQNMYPLINRLRQRIELQRRFVARMGVPH